MQSIVSILFETIAIVGCQRDPWQDHGRKPHHPPEPSARPEADAPLVGSRGKTRPAVAIGTMQEV